MKTKQFQPERLRRLTFHLLRHQKSLKKYSCTYVPVIDDNEEPTDESIPYYLYAMFEAAKVFPQEWLLNNDGFAYWIHDEKKATFSSVMNFFGLYINTFCHLFIPGGQNPAMFGGKILSTNASPKDIAENMLEFIKLCEVREN